MSHSCLAHTVFLMRSKSIRLLVSFALVVFFLSVVALPALPSSASNGCLNAGSTGLTAKVVATAGQTIGWQTVSANGCDVGIYVGPGANHVTITHDTVNGANDHGIFVQDASYITITHNTVTGNQLHTRPDCTPVVTPGCIAENKAVELVGSSHSLVSYNIVSFNNGSPGGGIGIADDGQLDPGAPVGHPGNPNPSNYNTISDNTVTHNLADCQIVVAAYNPGEGVSNNIVENNMINVGVTGIVVATDLPNTVANNNIVRGNTITNEFIPGIIIHNNAPGDTLHGTIITGNTLSSNGPDAEVGANFPTGILISGIANVNTPGNPINFTRVSGNKISNEYYGIWSNNVFYLDVHSNTFVRNVTLQQYCSANCGYGTFSAYTVMSGDTLYKIGLQFGLPWQQIASSNNIHSPYTIYIGQVIFIPSSGTIAKTYTVKPGVTFAAHLEPLSDKSIQNNSAPLGIVSWKQADGSYKNIVAFIFTLAPGQTWQMLETGFSHLRPPQNIHIYEVSCVSETDSFTLAYDKGQVDTWNSQTGNSDKGYAPNPNVFNIVQVLAPPEAPFEQSFAGDSIHQGNVPVPVAEEDKLNKEMQVEDEEVRLPQQEEEEAAIELEAQSGSSTRSGGKSLWSLLGKQSSSSGKK